MKAYRAKKMIRKSRHFPYYSTLEPPLREAVLREMDQLIREEQAFCDSGNYQHLCNLFAAIALYQVLRQQGKPKEEALHILAEELYRFILPGRDRFRRLAKRFWFWPVMKKLIPVGFRLGSGVGWRYTWFPHQPRDQFQFEVNECIYQKIFRKRGLEELGPIFCKCDVIQYGQLPGIDFQRTGTLCHGDEMCDFRFVKYPKNVPFVRTESR